MNAAGQTGFATRRPAQLRSQPPERAWLIDRLWLNEACGIIGGQPKSCKSYLALSAAVAVASGRACLNRFAVSQPGPALIYPAEDASHIVRQRLQSICSQAGADFENLNVEVITTPNMRLDFDHERLELRQTVERIRPRLLILDPFARLHRVNENLSTDVAPMLDFLRHLQQRFHTAVMLVHHTRKSTGASPGQNLRGSSDLHAWGDSNLYLCQQRNHRLQLSAEHRAASSSLKLNLKLHSFRAGPALTLTAPVTEQRTHRATQNPYAMSNNPGNIAG